MIGEGVKARVLVVDDEPKITSAIAMALNRSGYLCAVAADGRQALELFRDQGADLVITDRRMPLMDGDQLLRRLLELEPGLPVILLTAYGDVRSAVESMRAGAFDYITKPFDLDELRAQVSRAVEWRRLKTENRRLRRRLADRRSGELVAESRAMLEVLDLVDRAASSSAGVLIQGESGTGKEVIARRLHYAGPLSGGPFVAVNCKAFAPGVLESELFGHEKGAFTGADQARRGCFERAHGGTLFLDEIGDMELEFQAKLLRVLQENEVRRVGGDRTIPVSVRVISATHRDLRQGIADGDFREDLYYRLRVIPIQLPALRRRRDDILPLARLFLERCGRRSDRSFSWHPEAEQAMLSHPWPGNVRELENAVERAAALARNDQIGAAELLLEEPLGVLEPASGTLQQTLDRAAAERIAQVLADHHGRRAAAAAELGIDRTTLFRWIKRLGLRDGFAPGDPGPS